MEKELISVIIPAYNSENYIERCVNSILMQTYGNIEIIIINDGSKDKTREIIETLQQTDDRIILLNKENGGVSAARNDGVLKAKGKYIYFLDSDDYVGSHIIEELYEAIVNGCQMSVCGFINVLENKKNVKFSLYNKKVKINRKEYLIKMSEYLYSVYYGSLWNKLYVANIIKDNRIMFRNDISYAEDFIFNLDYLEYVENVTMLPECMYYYQENEASLTKKADLWYIWEVAKIRLQYCVEKYEKMNVLSNCKKNIDTAIANELVGPTYDIVKDKKINKRTALKRLKNLYDNEFARGAIKNTTNPQMVHRIAKISFGLHSYNLFFALMKIWVKLQRYR